MCAKTSRKKNSLSTSATIDFEDFRWNIASFIANQKIGSSSFHHSRHALRVFFAPIISNGSVCEVPEKKINFQLQQPSRTIDFEDFRGNVVNKKNWHPIFFVFPWCFGWNCPRTLSRDDKRHVSGKNPDSNRAKGSVVTLLCFLPMTSHCSQSRLCLNRPAFYLRTLRVWKYHQSIGNRKLGLIFVVGEVTRWKT